MEKLEPEIKNNQRLIIGLCGKKGVGKSFVAKRIQDRIGGQVCSFADPIRWALSAMGVDFSYKNKEVVQTQFGKSARQLAQTFGTEWGRNMVKDSIWVDHMISRINDSSENIIIDDIRFDNEAAAIVALGGSVFKIIGQSIYDAPDGHESESGLSEGVGLYNSAVVNAPDTYAAEVCIARTAL